MSEFLDFYPTKESDYYFLSYNSEDMPRVKKIANELSGKIPIWYDYDIPYGDEWEKTISKKIADAKAILLFFTKGILFKHDSYVQKEFKIANLLKKDIYVILVDTFDDILEAIDGPEFLKENAAFWVEITNKQNIEINEKLPSEQTAKVIYDSLSDQVVHVDVLNQTITEEELEPEVPVRVRKVAAPKGLLGKKAYKAEMAAVRQENKEMLTEIRGRLHRILSGGESNAVQAYQCAREATVLVRDQLGAYDWEYALDVKIADFSLDYESNLAAIKKAVLGGRMRLSPGEINQMEKVVSGLDGIIQIL